jgi:hypothetical protein
MRTSTATGMVGGLSLAIVVAGLAASTAQAAAAPEAASDEDAAEPTPPEAAAPAESPAPAKPARARRAFPKLSRPSLTHDMQFGIALLSGSGYRVVFPYQENIYCGQLDDNNVFKRVCSRRVPIFIDVQPSFGLNDRWDLLVDLRFGIEHDFTATRQFAVAPGFRYWVDPQLPVKFFATVQVAYDTTTQHNPQIKNNDFAFRNSNGLMIEVMRNLGFYAQFGETIGFVRWLRFEIDLGLGVQARFP